MSLGSFTDERGEITDLLDRETYALTRVTTVKGAVRGNHYHPRTEQWVYLISGQLQMAGPWGLAVLYPGEVWHTPAGEPHAWRAIEDSDCIVCAEGPRRAEAYEQDTIRLGEPLL